MSSVAHDTVPLPRVSASLQLQDDAREKSLLLLVRCLQLECASARFSSGEV